MTEAETNRADVLVPAAAAAVDDENAAAAADAAGGELLKAQRPSV